MIELEVKRPRNESFSGIGLHRTAHARLIVNVPRETDVRAQSGDGSIRIERVTGRIELRTGDGSIRASEIVGRPDARHRATARSPSKGPKAGSTVDTGDGSVNVAGRLGSVKLHTGDGSIVYRAEPGSTMTDPWEITTGDGSVSLYLPADFGAELDAHTGDGTIRNDFEIDSPVERGGDEEKTKRTVRGKIGSGGKLLRIRTGDGAIRLKSN